MVDITNPNSYNSGMDISMFIRTRQVILFIIIRYYSFNYIEILLKQADGFIFYFGSEMGTGSYITGQLLDGNLVVKVYFDGKKEKFQVSSAHWVE